MLPAERLLHHRSVATLLSHLSLAAGLHPRGLVGIEASPSPHNYCLKESLRLFVKVLLQNLFQLFSPEGFVQGHNCSFRIHENWIWKVEDTESRDCRIVIVIGDKSI